MNSTELIKTVKADEFTCAQPRHNMAADIPYFEVTRKVVFKMADVQFQKMTIVFGRYRQFQ